MKNAGVSTVLNYILSSDEQLGVKLKLALLTIFLHTILYIQITQLKLFDSVTKIYFHNYEVRCN
jgi:hypothetical protein